MGSIVPEALGLKFAIPLTFIAIIINELRKIDPHLRSFENIRIIHEFCTSESEYYDIEVVDNEDFDETTNTLTQLIINTLQEQVNSNLPLKS